MLGVMLLVSVTAMVSAEEVESFIGPGPGFCGNQFCGPGENCVTCPQDCGPCEIPDDGCSDCELTMLVPDYNHFYCTDELLIDWTAVGEDCQAPWNVYYTPWDPKDGCDVGLDAWGLGFLGLAQVTELPWDTSELTDGQYCTKVTGSCCDAVVEGPFCMDCTEPEVEVCVDSCKGDLCSEGIESDEWTEETQTVIEIDYEDPENDCDAECQLECMIDWGDGSNPQPCYGRCGDFLFKGDHIMPPMECGACDEWGCYHQYADDGEYTVTVTVTDCADNEGSDSQTVEVLNVDPVCEGIEGPTDAAVGQEVEFEASAHDVDADEPLMYTWDFDDESSNEVGNPVSHTFGTEGVYMIEVTVDDGDGGTDTCMHEIDVVEPIALPPQEVAAYYPLMADFGEEVQMGHPIFPNQFYHEGVTGFGTCSMVQGPNNLFVGSDGGYACGVRWDNDDTPFYYGGENPTNDEQGPHQVLIRVSNGAGDYEYYEFTVIVYSWIIDLEEGWNLISIPYIPDDTSIESVMLDQLGPSGQNILPNSEQSVVWSYQFNGEESEWLKSQRDGTGDLDNIVPGYGYWIKANGEGKLRGFGTQIAQYEDDPGMPPEVEVPTNHWSLIGRYGILGEMGPGNYHYPGEDPWDAGAVSVMKALESLTKLDNELHVFEITENIHLNEVQKLWNNEGYWLWVEDEAFNNANTETYAPLDKYYMEDLDGCGHGCHLPR